MDGWGIRPGGLKCKFPASKQFGSAWIDDTACDRLAWGGSQLG